jgi:hypothetical protein
MDVVALLHRVASPADLLTLVRALGHEAAWQELPPDSLPVEPCAAALLGRSGAFEWLAVSAHPAAETARRLSAALALRARLTGVLALDLDARQLAIAITVDRTAVASLALDQPTATDCERWQRLASLGPLEGLAFALRAMEVIEGEDCGRRFFTAFRGVLERMAEGIEDPLSPADRRALALIQLTRVLFLYFVQAKGWLDGRPDFLRRAVDDALARRRRLHRDLFRPLFFGTLNRPPAGRRRSLAFGAIPFLNGGLFEPHPLERVWRGDIPNDSWREAFDTLFERFHFTVHEGPDVARVAPDMLGRVFEGVMARDDRRATGSFYTPAALVERMVDAALASLVAERCHTSVDEARDRLARPDQRVRRLLADVTILDPAVGSGAFLLGALERLAQLNAGETGPADLRRRILARNLFGIDLNPMAVRLAELRLWLAVIAADDTAPPGAVAPLPNLDGQIRQGDSLLDPAWALARVGVTPGGSASELGLLRRSFAAASGPEKSQLQRQLRRAESRVFEEGLDRAHRRLEIAVAECLQSARTVTLFGERRGLDHGLRDRLRALRARMAEVRRLRRRLQRDGEVPGFSCECHFGDVLARGGFDLVVGNPPWVRAEQIPGRLRQQLAERYGWWRASSRGFAHQPDLALAFVERSGELLAPGGVMALLLPSKVATAQYARRMRGVLAERFTLHALADLSDDPVAAFDATTYPTALVAAKAPPPADHQVRLALGSDAGARCPQGRLTGGGPWVLATPPLLDALALARADHPRLGERYTPQLGVKTGANVVFLDPPPEIESALLCQALRGRDVAPFVARPRVRLFFPHGRDGLPFARLPENALRHVRRHAQLLRARVDYRGGPLWTLFRVRGALGLCRVVWPDLARRLGAAALTGRTHARLVPLNTCYVIALPNRSVTLVLTAWLNSTWIRALARTAADKAAGGFARFNARVVADLPLPPSVLADSRLSALAERGAEGEQIQEELDDVCAEHLRLPRYVRTILAEAAGSGTHDRGGVAGRG